LSTWQAIAEHIAAASGEAFRPGPPRGLGGGCINQAFRLADGQRSWFVKTNRADSLPMFEAEADGLTALGASGAIRVPAPLCTGVVEDTSFIVLEFIELGAAGARGARLAGERLAALHGVAGERFGWHRDNTIGATPQPNAWDDDWVSFWRERRLGFQLDLARRNGCGGRLQTPGAALLERLPALLGHAPRPALLHGDLWAGNLGFSAAGEPVIYDPACYYGDRETDLAMTELFGGFGRDFYAAYEACLPLDPGYRVRRTLYQLYHVLNHLNLFGGGYAAQAERMLQALLAECR
jgi:fructosamine-3-kinase